MTRHRPNRAARERERYAQDPEYRAKRYAATRRWLEKQKENTEYIERRRAKARADYRRRQAERPMLQLVLGAQARARKTGVPFDIRPEDIYAPARCPALGLELRYGGGPEPYPAPNSASLDRLIPELGYVVGNVRVISHLANQIKGSATLEQIEAVADWLRKQIQNEEYEDASAHILG